MEKKINLNEEIIHDRVSPTNNNLKKSISHNLEKNEINARRNLIQEKLKLKKLQIKKGNNLELYKYKSEKLNYPFTSNHQSICSSNLENLNENNNNIHYKKFNKKLKVKLNLINYFSQL